jgi:hypothetical protein
MGHGFSLEGEKITVHELDMNHGRYSQRLCFALPKAILRFAKGYASL